MAKTGWRVSAMRRFLWVLVLLVGGMGRVCAQYVNPVKVTVSFEEAARGEALLTFAMSVQRGWHVYGTQSTNGPTPTTLHVEKISGAELVGSLTAATPPVKRYEAAFGTEVYYHEGTVTFTQKVKLSGGKYELSGYLQYGACDDQNCTPPTSVDFRYSGELPVAKSAEQKVVEDAPVAPPTVEKSGVDTLAVAAEADSVERVAPVEVERVGDSAIWTSVVDQLRAMDSGVGLATDTSLWQIFLLGLLGGLVALVTPCVWPVVPMTVSFFLKRGTNKNSNAEELAAAKRRGLRDAVLYGLSIVAIYVSVGLVITAISGASALNDLATNAVFNILFFLLLVVFGISFIGGFELTLPSRWNNAVDDKANRTTGLLSIFFMAFALVLVSFSCTGPVIGFLLVQVVTSNIAGPVVGMLGFALALAFPFSLFALFPQWLKSVPKSGNWMNVVKVTLGFVELAFALKFFSVADLAYGWGLLDREVFLSLWIVLSALLGAYLMGWVRFPHDEDDGATAGRSKTSVPRFFLALLAFSFAVYMVPGLWGAPLKAVSAFAPPLNTQDFKLAAEHELEPMFTDYEEGMRYAKEHDMPVMLDFTGYGCVNCRKMEAAVFPDPDVADLVANRYVLIQLHVDDKTRLDVPIVVGEKGAERKLRTVGDKWSYLQSRKFGATTQPFYVLVDGDGMPLAPSRSYDENVRAFVAWLNSGLDAFGR